MSYFEIHTKYGGHFIEVEQKGGESSMYWLTGIAGFFLMLAPYIFNYAGSQMALFTSVGIGLVVLGASIWEGLEKRKENWEYWLAGIVGTLAILAPFVLGFGSYTSAMWTTVIMGAVIAVLGFGKVLTGGMPRE